MLERGANGASESVAWLKVRGGKPLSRKCHWTLLALANLELYFRRFLHGLLLGHQRTLGHDVRDHTGAQCVA